MKKLFLLSFLSISILMVSCKKEEALVVKKNNSNTVMYGAKSIPNYGE
jgi:hypothetical protein